MIVDADETIHTSSYSRSTSSKEHFEEIAAPQCPLFVVILIPTFCSLYIPGHFFGSVFVTALAKMFLESMSLAETMPVLVIINHRLDLLANSSYLDDLEYIVQCFDKTTKLRFRKAEEPQYMKFGSTRDYDEECNIRSGQLRLEGLVSSHLNVARAQCLFLGLMLPISFNPL